MKQSRLFIDKAISAAALYWRSYSKAPFLVAMEKGTLSQDAFRDYIVQDSLYLRAYLKCFGYAVAKSRTLREMQLFYEALGYVSDGENKTRLAYLEEFGLSDADIDEMTLKPVGKAYAEFLLTTAKQETVEDIVMVTMPCLMGYYDVFTTLVERSPHLAHGYYAPMVADYTSSRYAAYIESWRQEVERLCAGLDNERQAALIDLFVEASRHELAFWKMLL